jgi:hypothetical protein
MIELCCVIGYLGIGGVVAGYIHSTTNYPNSFWETPFPFFGGLLWPLICGFFVIWKYPIRLGQYLGTKAIEHKTIRLEERRKALLELKNAEKELNNYLDMKV